MEETKQQAQSPIDALSSAQLEKLHLEIQNLKSRSKWVERVAGYIPLITTLIAVAGLTWSVWQVQGAQRKAYSEQERERINKIQSQIRSDKEQLLDFISTDKITIPRVVFLLGDLNSLIEQISQSNQEKLNVTNLLVSLIRSCNFNDPRQINLDTQAMMHWDGYSDYWKENRAAHNDLLNIYRAAFLTLHNEDPSYFESIEYARGFYKVKRITESSRSLRFIKLVEGYKLHLDILEQEHNAKDLAVHINGFELAMKNPTLTKQLFESQSASNQPK